MIKHNKIKNTGFLYECLTRQITSDVLSNIEPSPALKIVKEFFKPTTILGKELLLYKALTTKKLKTETKINYLLDLKMVSVAFLSMKLKKINAEANVACPHKSTSIVGVKKRITFEFKFINAVSDKLFSAAIFCIKSGVSSSSWKTTPAGLPPKTLLVKESTK